MWAATAARCRRRSAASGHDRCRRGRRIGRAGSRPRHAPVSSVYREEQFGAFRQRAAMRQPPTVPVPAAAVLPTAAGAAAAPEGRENMADGHYLLAAASWGLK